MTTQEQEFVPLCKTTDVRAGEGRHFRPTAGRLRNKSMAVFNDNGKFYITNFFCPHSGGPLSEGTITDGIIECPWHAWTYSAETGMSPQPHGHSIAVYEMKIEGDQILVGGIKKPDS